MNVPTIEVPTETAQRKLAAYRAQLRRRADAEYEAAAAGYEALAEGKPLLSLADAINSAGLGDDGRPRLAIARADRKQVKVSDGRFSWRSRVPIGHIVYDATSENFHAFDYAGSLRIDVRWRDGKTVQIPTGYALVPMVPADVRPSGQLRDYFILWEVEQWSDARIGAKPDIDPYLLRHLAGDLYIVEAEWDLTELERAIMSGRRED